MINYDKLVPPVEGKRIRFKDGKLLVPKIPIIPRIIGDGSGRDIWKAAERIFNTAVEKSFKGKKKIIWFDVDAGETAYAKYGEWMPQDTLKAIDYYNIAIKGPLTTPIGGGIRSLNVFLRQHFNLYACVRPVRYFKGVPSPVKHPELMDVVIYRENTEDVYAGIEYKYGTEECEKVRKFLTEEMKAQFREDASIGIKPISITGTKQLVRSAIKYAIDRKRKVVTLMHKGNIMKFTEGAFKEWGYEVAKEEFPDVIVTEEELQSKYNGKLPDDKILLNDRIADSMFQQILTRSSDYSVIATPNLNGDYISDACAAQVGGLGMAPGANIGDRIAVFEATHGTAPKYAGQDKVNPCSLILSGVMMFEHIGWNKPAKKIVKAIEKTIKQKFVTYDLERLMKGATLCKTSEFATKVIENL